MIHKQKTMQKQQLNKLNNKLKLFKKLAISVGYVWTFTFLCSALFRDEIINLICVLGHCM